MPANIPTLEITMRNASIRARGLSLFLSCALLGLAGACASGPTPGPGTAAQTAKFATAQTSAAEARPMSAKFSCANGKPKTIVAGQKVTVICP